MTDPIFSAATLRTTAGGLRDALHRTPLLSSRTLADRVGRPVYLKCESMQKTGSFKVRGALNRIRRLTADERARGWSRSRQETMPRRSRGRRPRPG